MLHYDQITLEVPKSDTNMVRVVADYAHVASISTEYEQFMLDLWTGREMMKATATPEQACKENNEHG
ncbi:hypothetical protein ACFX2H_009466 [Malus domestica]